MKKKRRPQAEGAGIRPGRTGNDRVNPRQAPVTIVPIDPLEWSDHNSPKGLYDKVWLTANLLIVAM